MLTWSCKPRPEKSSVKFDGAAKAVQKAVANTARGLTGCQELQYSRRARSLEEAKLTETAKLLSFLAFEARFIDPAGDPSIRAKAIMTILFSEVDSDARLNGEMAGLYVRLNQAIAANARLLLLLSQRAGAVNLITNPEAPVADHIYNSKVENALTDLLFEGAFQVQVSTSGKVSIVEASKADASLGRIVRLTPEANHERAVAANQELLTRFPRQIEMRLATLGSLARLNDRYSASDRFTDLARVEAANAIILESLGVNPKATRPPRNISDAHLAMARTAIKNRITLTASLLGAAQRTVAGGSRAMVEEGVTFRERFVDSATAKRSMMGNIQFLLRTGASQPEIDAMMLSLARTAAVLEVAGHKQLALDGITPVLAQYYQGNPAQLMVEALIEVAQDAGARRARGYQAQVAEVLAARLVQAADTRKGDGWGLTMSERLTQRAVNAVRDSASIDSVNRVAGLYGGRLSSESGQALERWVARVQSGEILDVRGLNAGSRFGGVHQSDAALARAAKASQAYLNGLVEAVSASRTAGSATARIDGNVVNARSVNLAALKAQATAYKELSGRLAREGASQAEEAERVRTSYAALQSVRRAEFARRTEPAGRRR